MNTAKIDWIESKRKELLATLIEERFGKARIEAKRIKLEMR